MDPENVGILLELMKSACEELQELNQGVGAIVSALGDLVEVKKERLGAFLEATQGLRQVISSSPPVGP